MCAMGGYGAQELPDGPKIRQPTFLEELCEMGHIFDTMLTGYALRLRTPHRITREEMLKAMLHLRRYGGAGVGGTGRVMEDGMRICGVCGGYGDRQWLWWVWSLWWWWWFEVG